MSNPGLTNLQCWWKLDEGSGTRYDEMERVNLAQAGGVAWADGHQIFTDRAAEFNAANNEYLWTSDPNDYLRAGDFPICFGLWIKPHTAAAGMYILAKWGTVGKEYQIYISASIIKFSIYDANGEQYDLSAEFFGTLSNDTWYFIGAYFDPIANEIGVSVNNVWNDDSVGVYPPDSTSEWFTIGADADQNWNYDGLIDEVFFYKNRLLTPAEWTWLYNSGVGRRFEDVSQISPPSVNVATKRMMPEIYVYDEALDFLGIIENYSSLNWAERYNSEGDFELELPISYAPSSLLTFGNFLYIGTSDKLMVVEEKKPTKSPTEGKLLVNGRSVETILRRRELMNLNTFVGCPAEYLIYSRVYWHVIDGAGDADRIIDLFEDGSGDTWPPAMESSAAVSVQYETENLYEVIETLAKTVDLGFKITVAQISSPSSNKLYFLVYAGLDRSGSVIFSDSFDNLLNSSFLTTEKDQVNLAVVFTDDAVYEKVFVWAGGSSETPGGTEPTGLNRFERRLDTTIDRGGEPEVAASTPGASTNPTLGIAGKVALIAIGITSTPAMALPSEPLVPLTNEAVLAIIEERGRVVIKENTPVVIFDGDVDARTQFIIDKDFFLGDIVQVNAHGIKDKARVIEVVKSYSVEGEKIYIAFDFEV